MIKLTKMLELIGMENLATIYQGNTKIYFGECGKCPMDIWGHAYVSEMKYSNETFRYIIKIRYM